MMIKQPEHIGAWWYIKAIKRHETRFMASSSEELIEISVARLWTVNVQTTTCSSTPTRQKSILR